MNPEPSNRPGLDILGEAVSSRCVCFKSRKSLLSGQQAVWKSSQGLLTFDRLCGCSTSVPWGWQHVGGLAAPRRGLSREAEESLSGGLLL